MTYIKTNNELYHYGVPRRSGRYKWGSGERPYQGDNINTVGSASSGISGFLKRKSSTDTPSNSVKTPKYKKASEMTTEELKEFNSRQVLEDNYNKHVRKDPTIRKLNTAKSVADYASTAVNETSRQVDKYYQDKHRQEKANIDLSKVSDEELRRVVNRMNLEQQYRNLSPTYVSEGESKSKEVLATIGSLTAIAASSIGIAVSIKELMRMH